MNKILEIKKKSLDDKVPIIQDDSIEYINNYIKENNIKNILELGTATGYSAIMMASSNDVHVTSIERDESRYLEAVKNVKACNLEDKITLIFKDALEVELDDKYDLIFIDAAKGQNIKFFTKYEKNLKDKGTIITDNMLFHGYVEMNEEDITSKNIRGIVRKIKDYMDFLYSNNEYDTELLHIGDGLFVSKRR